MADPKKVKVFDGTNWVDLKADDPNLPISSADKTVTIDGEGNKVSVYGNSGLPDITPIVLEIKTTANGSGWSNEDAWGKLSFWNDDASSGGAKQHAFIECVAWNDGSGGLSTMRLGTGTNTWMSIKPTGSTNFTPLNGTSETESTVLAGDFYYDSRYNFFRYHDGTQWKDLSPDSTANGYFWNNRGEGNCVGEGITESSPVIPVNKGTKYAGGNDYMLADGAVYYITLGTKSTGSVACAKYVVRKIDGVFTAEIMSSNNQVSNTPIISVRPTTQIDPNTSLPYVDRHEVVVWDNHTGNYSHTWNVEGMLTGSVQQQFSINNPWYTVGAAIYQNDASTYVCLDNISSKDQAIQDVMWNYSSGSFFGKWGDPSDTGVKNRVQFNTYDPIATIAQAPNPSNNDTYGRWYERPRRNLKLYSSNTDSVFEVSTNAYDGTYYCYNGDPAEAFAEGLFKAVEYDGEGTNAENVTKIRFSARDKNSKDMNHTRTYVSPEYLEDSSNINGTDWMLLQIVQDDGSRKSASYMVTSGGYTSTGPDAPAGSQPYYEYGVKWYGSGTAGGTDLNGGKEGAAHFVQYFRNNTGMLICENGNTQLTRLSVDFNHADGGFYTAATARLAAERKGSTGAVQLCGYTHINSTTGLVKNFQADYYNFDIYAQKEKVGSFSNTGLDVAGTVSSTLIDVTTSASTLAVLTSTTQSSQIKCVAASGTTWHGINNGKWAVDYYRTGTTTYTEGLRLDLADGRVTSKGGIGTDTITTKNNAVRDVITYLAGTELRVNTGIEKPAAPGTYGRSNTFIVEPNAVQVLANINTGNSALAPADLVIGYATTVGSTTPFGFLQWQAWDDSSNKNMISFCEIGIDPVDGAGRGNGGELIFKTKEANIDGTTERLRITKNDIKAQTGYVPQTDDSLVTKGWVESVIGSGGSVNPDTVPGTGATLRWDEQSVDVSTESNQQQYNVLYAYDGIFTDGLHWTSDGHQWHTSDPTLRLGPLGNTVDGDDGKVVKGNGNEYITARYISSDMKAWRLIGSAIGDKPFYLDGEFYASNGSQKYSRSGNNWISNTAFGGTLSTGSPKNVASQESGLYVLAIHTDGTVHWSVGLDGPSQWQQVVGLSGAKCCKFIERMGKWLVIGESTFSISDGANLAALNWTTASLPTAANWDRIADDGGTISITSTEENFNLVLYCTVDSGPSVEADWLTTVNYSNRGYEGFNGTNGRTIGSMKSAVSGDVRSFYYSISGDNRSLSGGFTSKQLNDQNKTNEFLLQEISRLQKLIEEKCDS